MGSHLQVLVSCHLLLGHLLSTKGLPGAEGSKTALLPPPGLSAVWCQRGGVLVIAQSCLVFHRVRLWV